MRSLLADLEDLKRSEVKKVIDSRMADFKKIGKGTNDELFKELCFCLMTANCSAQACIDVQAAVGEGFIILDEKSLSKRLKEVGYRYPNKRAHYIVEARKHKDKLRSLVSSLDEFELREWLAKNVKGLGFKEASHFMRNIGFENVAIIDRHILRVLANNNLIEMPKTMNRKKYLEIENVLEKIGKEVGLKQGELDFYLWFMQTGKVLK